VKASYYAPLVAALSRLDAGRPVRVEVPLTGAHWEADRLAGRLGGHVLLARGWERQLDTRDAALFYRPHLTAGAYRAWLYDNAVAFVALPDVRLDHAGAAEGRLVAGGLPFLRPVWRGAHWRLYAVQGARPLISAPAQLVAVGADGATLAVPRVGAYTLRIHFTPYWEVQVGRGCAARASGDWTAVRTSRAGTLRLGIGLALSRVLGQGPRCRFD
jgi:hypothetical protein